MASEARLTEGGSQPYSELQAPVQTLFASPSPALKRRGAGRRTPGTPWAERLEPPPWAKSEQGPGLGDGAPKGLTSALGCQS